MYEEYLKLENLKKIMQDSNEYNVERIKKVKELIDRGVNPYPYKFNPNTTSKSVSYTHLNGMK